MIKAVLVALGLMAASLSPHVWHPQPTVRPESVSGLETGVWWVGQPDLPVTSPTPNTVPAGGMWVSSTIAGTTAMSAMRFTVGANDRQPIVNLPIAMVTTLPAALPIGAAATIVACPTTTQWKPPAKGTFGALSTAPKYDCSKGQVIGAQAIDGKSLTFELTQFVTDSNKTISVALVPASVPLALPVAPPVALPIALPNTLIPPTFDATFKPVTSDAIEVLAGAPATTEADVSGANLDETPRYDTALLPALVPSAPAVTSTPTTGIAAVPRQIAQAATNVTKSLPDDLHKHERIAAAAVFALLCIWGWVIFNQDPIPGVKQAGRPYRTLYDGAPTATRRRKIGASSSRSGRPPSLR